MAGRAAGAERFTRERQRLGTMIAVVTLIAGSRGPSKLSGLSAMGAGGRGAGAEWWSPTPP